MPQVRWADSPPVPDPLPKISLVVPRVYKGVDCVLLNARLVGAPTHWHPPSELHPRGRRMPCLLDQCDSCKRGWRCARYWWIGCCSLAFARPAILELTEDAAIQLVALSPDLCHLRGLPIHAEATRARRGHPTLVTLLDRDGPLPFELPAPVDVKPHLEKLWGLRSPAMESDPPHYTPKRKRQS